MTLITYLTRVHFADGVLEEALRSEMERHAKRRPLVIAEAGDLGAGTAERFFSSFPIRTRVETFSAVPHSATEAAARQVARAYRTLDCDLLIAFGSNRAIDLAKVARVAISYDEPIAALSAEQGGAHRITADLPDLYCVPGVLGFASAITDYTRVKLDAGGQVLLSSRFLIPTVTICDPTLTLGAGPEETATAAGGVLARAVDAYLAPGFNPPAEGLALDAITRVVPNVRRALDRDGIAARRELMASGLNSSLAMQKGLCAVHAVSNAVAAVSARPIDPSALGAVFIPALARHYDRMGCAKTGPVKQSLAIPADQGLGRGLGEIISELPLPLTLTGLGVAPSDLPAAAALAAGDRAITNSAVRFTAETLLGIMREVEGDSAIAASG